MRGSRSIAVAAVLAVNAACGGDSAPSSPTPAAGTAAVRFAYRASTTPRTDLPPSARDCVQGVGRTHIHPSWRGFDRFEMILAGADRWEIAFSDVPVNARQGRVAARPDKASAGRTVRFRGPSRVSDGNACDENPTGAALRNVFANDVLLVEVVPTPGSGTEPGLAFTVASDGRVTP